MRLRFVPEVTSLEERVTLSASVNAYVNLAVGPYPEAALIASGHPSPWYQSAAVAGVYGRPLTWRDVNVFNARVFAFVNKTFAVSGVHVSLTMDPGVVARHTLSLVSNSTSRAYPTSIGTTDIGYNGFSFVDQEAKAARSVDDLQWIVAHNIAHELMLSFGVAERYDQTGTYVDSTNVGYDMMASPDSKFSPAAAAAINAALKYQG
jgi:hypothetical protein